MKNLKQHYYAIVEHKVCAQAFTRLWNIIQEALKTPYLQMKLNRIGPKKRKEFADILHSNVSNTKKEDFQIISLEVHHLSFKDLKALFQKAEVSLIKLIRIPPSMNSKELALPSHLMRDLF